VLVRYDFMFLYIPLALVLSLLYFLSVIDFVLPSWWNKRIYNFDLFRTCTSVLLQVVVVVVQVVPALLRVNWQDFNWHDASRGPSAIAELLVGTRSVWQFHLKPDTCKSDILSGIRFDRKAQWHSISQHLNFNKNFMHQKRFSALKNEQKIFFGWGSAGPLGELWLPMTS